MTSDTKVRLEALHLMQAVTTTGKGPSTISHSALSFCGSIIPFIGALISSSKAFRSSSWSVPQVQLPLACRQMHKMVVNGFQLALRLLQGSSLLGVVIDDSSEPELVEQWGVLMSLRWALLTGLLGLVDVLSGGVDCPFVAHVQLALLLAHTKQLGGYGGLVRHSLAGQLGDDAVLREIEDWGLSVFASGVGAAGDEKGKMLRDLARRIAVDLGSCYALGCCNNPRCSNMAGMSEVGLVLGEDRAVHGVCSGCGVVCYCSRTCQVAAWPLHKRICTHLQAT